ncbi:hypothetical protein DY000_02053631 [Brassica cretica]|uniref:Arabidopsis retrotransposon Orf1 C-terminal domain-containing protein n=1 Tax=Brassica cretica TaxID=69181 RepID=A0ABQ7AKL2_BRACR|nr:hypothetical protein DY000_02053631 [Brassica cretica]
MVAKVGYHSYTEDTGVEVSRTGRDQVELAGRADSRDGRTRQRAQPHDGSARRASITTRRELIANGTFTSRKAYQSKIRNPTLRVIAKMVSNLLFANDQTSKVTKGELKMLYSGLEDEIRRARDIPIQSVNTNPGYHLIWMFYTRRDCLMQAENKSEGKNDRCGILLTPLFKYFGIDLRSNAVNH